MIIEGQKKRRGKSDLWKAWEREVASWLNTRRNPLSGGNNYTDDGKSRIGDVLLKDAVVEVKLRASISSISRARLVYQKAKERGLPFLQVERERGNKDLILLVVPYEDAVYLVQKWRERHEKEAVSDDSTGNS
ncbi:hypothetical protein [Hydrogenobacter thermophilus]|jgi:hypothetical protein|uniref:hypothetical protein n=1 Tax=Hydrogenobacter thermophilus TaxID=940 RepID=UPI0030F4C68F